LRKRGESCENEASGCERETHGYSPLDPKCGGR
jgi:hypothetical protein